MSKAHLTYFRVSNFKKFEDLELTNLGQFNLVVGDNNVGKTSLLEALLVANEDSYKSIIQLLNKLLLMRGIRLMPEISYNNKGEIVDYDLPKENFLKFWFQNPEKQLKLSHYTLNTFIIITNTHYENNLDLPLPPFTWDSGWYRDKSLVEITTVHDPEDEVLGYTNLIGVYEYIYQSEIEKLEIAYVPSNANFMAVIPELYSEYIAQGRKEKKVLIDAMKALVDFVDDIEIAKINGIEQLMIGVEGKNEWMPIAQFGESVTRATYLLLQIARNKGRRLMIDEVDTGIHHTRLKQFMKTLVQVADKYEVQLFMTTHSLECQHAFADALLSEDMAHFQQEARNVTLFVNKEGKTAAQTFDFESFRFALETNFETRGG